MDKELLGIIIPILMSGGSVMDVLKAVTGSGVGASNDGLQAMIRSQLSRAVIAQKLTPSAATVRAGASLFAEKIGFNPLSGPGQGIVELIRSAYAFSPDIVGSLIGVPDPKSFFQQISNGSGLIGMSSGGGMPQLFNPYSVRESHERAMRMARTVYEIGTNNGKGYNVDFGHGLNFDEMGAVMQRLLSSNIPYVSKDGTRLNPFDDTKKADGSESQAEQFKENIRKFGSKFNEAASMLAKITGSVDEAINIMDRLGGGNFLGGTAEEASDIANKAKRMAATIRMTAAIGRMKPQEVYERMSSLEGSIAQSMGVDSVLAKASGYGGFFEGAEVGATAYSQWAAMNPGATKVQQQQAWLGSQFRINSYYSSSGADVAAIVSANRDKFSEEDINRIERAYASGRPNDAMQLVEDRIGSYKLTAYMNDPAAVMAMRMYGDQATLRRLNTAGISGNLSESTYYGANRDLQLTFSDIDSRMSEHIGGRSFKRDVREKAEKEALVRLATSEGGGLTKDFASRMTTKQLERYLVAQPELDQRVVEREKNTAAINGEIEYIRSNTMTDQEEAAARTQLLEEMEASGKFSEKKKIEIRELARTNLFAAAKEVFDSNLYGTKERREKWNEISGGRLFIGESEEMVRSLEEQRRTWSVSPTEEEFKRAEDKRKKEEILENNGRLLGVVSRLNQESEYNKADTDLGAIDVLFSEANDLMERGQLSLGGKDRSSVTEEAISGMVKEIFDGNVGKLESKIGEKTNERYQKLVDTVSKSMYEKVKGGKTVKEAFSLAMAEVRDGKEFDADIGVSSNGKLANGQVDDWIEGKGTEKLTREGLGASIVSIMNRFTTANLDAFKIRDRSKIDAVGARADGKFAAAGAKDASSAVSVYAASMQRMGYEAVEIPDSVVNLIAALDVAEANKKQNAIQNAIQIGGGSVAKETIENGKENIRKLREEIKKADISQEELETALYGEDGTDVDKEKKSAALKKVEGAVGKVEGLDSKSGLAMLRAFKGAKFGKDAEGKEMTGYGILFGSGDEQLKKAEENNQEWARVIKESNRQDSVAYDIFGLISKFADGAAQFFDHPAVTIQNGVEVENVED